MLSKTMTSATSPKAFFAALVAVVTAVTATDAAAQPIVVTTTATTGWFGLNEGPSGSVGTLLFAPGPGTPPSGDGAASLEVDDEGRSSFGTNLYAGTPLSGITALTYSSYAWSEASLAGISLQFDVDYDGSDASTAYQGRLVFEPAGAPVADTWVAQDALAGQWWATRSPGKDLCPQASPCSWGQVLTAFPNATIRDDEIQGGALLFRLGGPIAGGALASVDQFSIGVGVAVDVYDFEPGATVTPPIGPAGSVVEVQAYGFRALRNVRAFYYTNNLKKKRIKICRTKTSLSGSFYCAVALPLPPDAGPEGVHQVRIRGPRRVEYYVPYILVP